MSDPPLSGEWCWLRPQATPARVIERQDLWGEVVYRVWLPVTATVAHVPAAELAPLASAAPDLAQVLHAAAAAKVLDALADNLLLAPSHSRVVPLPHQLYALQRAVSGARVRYLLADEVGLGKTIEAGLILRELKLRGLVKRILVVAPKGLVRQWQAELHLHFGETFRFIEPAELAAFRQAATDADDNLWRQHDQVICALDAVKPLEGRRGWSLEQLQAYNRERFEDLLAAAWDLVIIDEAHRLGGSTEQVARYKLGAALAESAPALLLLSATPHQGKTDHFLRLMQLLDREAFPDESSVRQDRVGPFVIRTEKRQAITAEGRPLFQPRVTRLQAVVWQARHAPQQRLYAAVTEYVRHGYNQALATQQRHIGFLMILMQRLVTSSTAAIRTTLEKRLAVLATPSPQRPLFDMDSAEDWAELDGQSQVEWALQAGGWERERAEVEHLLALARDTEAAGTDAKAEAVLDLIYKLQQEESAPALKVLIFTEFVPTQTMLADFLARRGFAVVALNGRMDLDRRTRAQQAFAQDARVLVSTDAGGEGLNLQFCHVVINFDLPWAPMRLEQRIGRVDRIGQRQVVRAINLVLADTVEYRVRQVLEEKLEIIAQEFGVDKAAEVMDSVETAPLFDDVYVQGLRQPDGIEAACAEVVSHLRSALAAAQQHRALLSAAPDLTATEARRWWDHPAQFWLERAITQGLLALGPRRGTQAVRVGAAWQLHWADGSVSAPACFDARAADEHPDWDWITLEDPRARALIHDLPRCVAGQPLPVVRLTGLPDTVQGIWSLWVITLTTAGRCRQRFLPVFITDAGRAFVPTAQRIWDLLVTAPVTVTGVTAGAAAATGFAGAHAAAVVQGEHMFTTLVNEHQAWLTAERERVQAAFAARDQALGRIGLPGVRAHRRQRLQQEQTARLAEMAAQSARVVDLQAIMMVQVAGATLPGGT